MPKRYYVSIVECLAVCGMLSARPSAAMDPGEWAYEHRDACVRYVFEDRERWASERRFGTDPLFAIRVTGHQALETQVVAWSEAPEDCLIRITTVGEMLSEQLGRLRSGCDACTDEEIFAKVHIEERAATAAQAAAVTSLMAELENIQVPAMPPGRFAPHGMIYDVWVQRFGDYSHFSFYSGRYQLHPEWETTPLERWCIKVLSALHLDPSAAAPAQTQP